MYFKHLFLTSPLTLGRNPNAHWDFIREFNCHLTKNRNIYARNIRDRIKIEKICRLKKVEDLVKKILSQYEGR